MLGKIVALLVIAAFIMSSLLTVNAADYSTPAPDHTNYPTATSTPTEKIEQTGVLAGLNWQTTIIAVMGAVIVGLVAALALSKRRHNLQISTY